MQAISNAFQAEVIRAEDDDTARITLDEIGAPLSSHSLLESISKQYERKRSISIPHVA